MESSSINLEEHAPIYCTGFGLLFEELLALLQCKLQEYGTVVISNMIQWLDCLVAWSEIRLKATEAGGEIFRVIPLFVIGAWVIRMSKIFRKYSSIICTSRMDECQTTGG